MLWVVETVKSVFAQPCIALPHVPHVPFPHPCISLPRWCADEEQEHEHWEGEDKHWEGEVEHDEMGEEMK